MARSHAAVVMRSDRFMIFELALGSDGGDGERAGEDDALHQVLLFVMVTSRLRGNERERS